LDEQIPEIAAANANNDNNSSVGNINASVTMASNSYCDKSWNGFILGTEGG